MNNSLPTLSLAILGLFAAGCADSATGPDVSDLASDEAGASQRVHANLIDDPLVDPGPAFPMGIPLPERACDGLFNQQIPKDALGNRFFKVEIIGACE